MTTPSYKLRPTTFGPRSAIAYALTLLGPPLHRRTRRYGFNALARIPGLRGRDQRIRARTGSDRLEFPALDQYYAEMFVTGAYEDEMYDLIATLHDADYTFVDAGANLGYWSVLVSGPSLGPHPTVAIEASWDTFDHLHRNAVLNGGRFKTVHAAVSSTSGDLLTFDDSAEHAARSLVTDGGTHGATSPVLSVTIDAIVAEFAPSGHPIVLKLDVEGAELAAIAGASATLDGHDTLLLVEDHGADRAHTVTAALLATGLSAWFLSPDQPAVWIVETHQLDALKVELGRGYNIVAHRPGSELARRAGLVEPVGWPK